MVAFRSHHVLASAVFHLGCAVAAHAAPAELRLMALFCRAHGLLDRAHGVDCYWTTMSKLTGV